MRSHRFALGVAVLVAASMLVTACAGGKDRDAAAGEEPVTISSVMGAPGADSIYNDYPAYNQGLQDKIFGCMAREGWEYIPVQYPDTSDYFTFSDEDVVARLSREGLGITYYLLYDGTEEGARVDPLAYFVDPNDGYVASLDAGARAAYTSALYGTPEEQAAVEYTETDPVTGEVTTYRGDPLGCYGDAWDAMNADDITSSPGYADAVASYYDELQTRVDADPRVIKLKDAWATCMSDAGYDYADAGDFYAAAYGDLKARVDAVVGPDFYADIMAGWSTERIDAFWASASEEDKEAIYDESRALTSDQRSQLEALLSEEIALALAEHSRSKDMNDKVSVISAQIEAQYAVDHAEELKALAESLTNRG